MKKPKHDLSEFSEKVPKLYDVLLETNRHRDRLKPELNIGIILWPEFPLLALAGLTDALRHAADIGDNSKKERCSWSIMSNSPGESVCSSSGINIQSDSKYLEPDQFDYIAVIGGLVRSLTRGESASRKYLHHAYDAGIPIIGICTGSFVLAQEGLLDGHRASVHPYHLEEFRSCFTKVKAEAGFDYIDEGSILTSPGGISTLSLATELISRHCGPDRATKVIHQISVPNKIDASPFSVSRAIGYTRVADPRLRSAVFIMEQSLAHPINLVWLSEQVNISVRQLTRLFKIEFNQTPTSFIRSIKLRYGHWLLKSSTESVTEIALRMGFCDCAHFIRNFRHEYGYTPGEFRAFCNVGDKRL